METLKKLVVLSSGSVSTRDGKLKLYPIPKSQDLVDKLKGTFN